MNINTADAPSAEAPQKRSWAERNGFSHWVLALFWLITAFIMFQVTALFVTVLLISLTHGGIQLDQMNSLISKNLNLVFIGNSTGQVLFLAGATWFFSRVQTTRENHASFFRYNVRSDTLQLMGLAFLLILALQPIIGFLGWINSFVPVPQVFKNLQTQQSHLISGFLKSNGLVWIALIHVALVPAICEETLFRGYIMRSFQKSWGIVAAIICSGFLFGLFHVQLGNLLPLAFIGMVLGWITWNCNSIFPSMIAHFVNNAGSILMVKYYPNSTMAQSSSETMPDIWLILLSIIVSGILISLMRGQRFLQNSTS